MRPLSNTLCRWSPTASVSAAAALSRGISENLRHTWKQQQQRAPHHLQAEYQELRVRLQQVEMERDILNKALSMFSRQT
jgi:transposase-like protein